VILAKAKTCLDVLDRQVSRLGRVGSTLVLTLLFVAGAIFLHWLVHLLDGKPIQVDTFAIRALETTLLAAPVFFYARSVIAAQIQSRAEMRDLSRRLAVAVDEAREASRAKSAFLANMSHELRTPLNAIIGFSEIMKDQHLGPVQNPRYLSYVGDIHASGRHLLSIINDVLDLAKIEAGKMSLDGAEEFDVAASITAALAMVSGLGEKYGVQVAMALRADGARLVAVERMVRQILINLVGNAIKFTPEGGQVQIEGGIAQNGFYRILVRDSGVGMNENEIANALVPFGQNANHMSAKHDGTGLGLPLAKAMMELHGGKLAIESQPGQGTTVILSFPAERCVKAPQIAAA
jgi:signal transduction histidine kinase